MVAEVGVIPVQPQNKCNNPKIYRTLLKFSKERRYGIARLIGPVHGGHLYAPHFFTIEQMPPFRAAGRSYPDVEQDALEFSDDL